VVGEIVMGAKIIMRNPITQRDVDYAAGNFQRLMELYGENNMATQRAEFAYRKILEEYEAKHPKARERRMSILRGR
jgi:hypothetical protein